MLDVRVTRRVTCPLLQPWCSKVTDSSCPQAAAVNLARHIIWPWITSPYPVNILRVNRKDGVWMFTYPAFNLCGVILIHRHLQLACL